MQFVGYLGDGVFHPYVVGVDQRFYALEVGQELVLVFGVEVAETGLDGFKVSLFLGLYALEDYWGVGVVQVSEGFVDALYSFGRLLLFLFGWWLAGVQSGEGHRVLFSL